MSRHVIERPQRIQLSRAKGWRMPENTVKVDRTTKWGNPFIVGRDGTTAQCVDNYKILLHGAICCSTKATRSDQEAAHEHVRAHIHELKGKNLACWCRPGQPCHADTLLLLAAGRDAEITASTPKLKRIV